MAKTSTNKKIDDEFKNLLGPTDPALDRQVREKLITARVGLLLRASFFGNLATRLKLVNADEWCSTAATDGRNFYYNSRFISMLRPKEIEFLFGHEVLHCVYDHFGRNGSRNPRIFNIANDFCVNADLKKHRVGEFITTVPCLYDQKYDGWCSEEVYDDLMKNAETLDIDQLVEQLLDEHLDGMGDDDGDGEGKGDGQGGGDGDGKEGKGKGRPEISEEERQRIRDEIKEAILAAAQTCDAGDLPAGVRRIIKEMTEPKLNWRELLRMQLETTIKADYSWLRASRRGWHMDAVMPGMKNDEMIDIFVFFDASGSMTDEMLRDQLGEVKGIMDQFSAYRIHVATFDTKVYNPQIYTSDNLEDITDYELMGGGGTDFMCMYHFMRDNEIEPKRLVVFTDGYPYGSWGEPDYADTVWILHGTTSIVPPFGQYAYYEAEKHK
jgi:predicted metal-dependent peptidase